jgi:hypothetical protein
MDKRTKTWVSIIVGVLIVLVVLGAAALGGTIYFVASHVRQAPVEEARADDRFSETRQRLARRQPLVEIDDSDDVVIRRAEPAAVAANGARLQTLRALVYDPREGRIVEVDIPFWLLRLMPSGGRFSFLNDSGIRFDSERSRLTLEDLERHGPGLVLDHRDRRGAQILVWTE